MEVFGKLNETEETLLHRFIDFAKDNRCGYRFDQGRRPHVLHFVVKTHILKKIGSCGLDTCSQGNFIFHLGL